MKSLRFENVAGTQVYIDGELFDLPFRINSIFEYSEVIIFHSYPKKIDSQQSKDYFENSGKYSLYAVSKKNKNIIWKMKNVASVFVENVQQKKEKDFISKKHYMEYLALFDDKELLTVFVGEFRKRIDANTGEIYSSMESR